jgi:hypothetical protein
LFSSPEDEPFASDELLDVGWDDWAVSFCPLSKGFQLFNLWAPWEVEGGPSGLCDVAIEKQARRGSKVAIRSSG